MDTIQFNEWLKEIIQVGIIERLTGIIVFFLLCLATYYLIHIGNRFVPANKILKFNSGQVKFLLLIIISFLIVAWIFANGNLFLSILTPFIIAGVISYAFNPVIKFMQKKKIGRTWAVVILFLVFTALGIAFSITIIPRLVLEVKQLLERLPGISSRWYGNLSDWFVSNLSRYSFAPGSIDEVLGFFGFDPDSISAKLVNTAGTIFSSIAKILSNVVMVITIPVITFYFMKDGEKIKGFSTSIIPVESKDRILDVSGKIDKVFGGFIRGQIIVSVFVGVMSGIALIIIGVDFWLILGLIAGVTNIIPYLGPFIGAVPAVLMTLALNPSRTIWVILAFVVIQQIESAIISPKIVGDRVGLHPALIIFALLAGGSFLGLVGLIVAVPLAGVIKVIVQELALWIREKYPKLMEKKLMEKE